MRGADHRSCAEPARDEARVDRFEITSLATEGCREFSLTKKN